MFDYFVTHYLLKTVRKLRFHFQRKRPNKILKPHKLVILYDIRIYTLSIRFQNNKEDHFIL